MDKHNLTLEFPQFETKIAALKKSDFKFRELFVNYEEINALIQHYEAGEQNHTTDEHLTKLRKTRVYLKDDLFNYLQKN